MINYRIGVKVLSWFGWFSIEKLKDRGWYLQELLQMYKSRMSSKKACGESFTWSKSSDHNLWREAQPRCSTGTWEWKPFPQPSIPQQRSSGNCDPAIGVDPSVKQRGASAGSEAAAIFRFPSSIHSGNGAKWEWIFIPRIWKLNGNGFLHQPNTAQW